MGLTADDCCAGFRVFAIGMCVQLDTAIRASDCDLACLLRDASVRSYPTGLPLRPARLRRVGAYTALQFTRGQTQSRMLGDAPDQLLIDYTRTMLAALLWQPRPRTICMVGLGGGSQAKFIHRHLPGARLEVVENHPG